MGAKWRIVQVTPGNEIVKEIVCFKSYQNYREMALPCDILKQVMCSHCSSHSFLLKVFYPLAGRCLHCFDFPLQTRNRVSGAQVHVAALLFEVAELGTTLFAALR